MADLGQVVNDLNLASQSLQELREKYDGALDLLDDKNTEITGALENAKSNALQEVQTASDTATSQISELKDTSLNLVNEAKNTAIEEVNNAVSGIDTSKEEALLAIEQAKAVQEEKITDLEQAKENIITEFSEKAKLLTENLEWAVGTGGKFENLQSAINEASKYTPINNTTITIKLKTGFILNEEIRAQNRNISFITITSETETKYDVDILTGKTIFYFINSKAPTLSIKLSPNKVDNGNTYIVGGLNSDGVMNGTFTDCPNVFYWDNGMLSIRGINVFNATKSIGSSANGTINSAGSDNENYTKFENCNASLFSSVNSKFYFNLSTFKNCITEADALYFNRGGSAVFTGTRFINCKCNSSEASFFRFYLGGIVQVSNVSFNEIDSANRCNISSNQITPNGIILVG